MNKAEIEAIGYTYVKGQGKIRFVKPLNRFVRTALLRRWKGKVK